MTVRVPATCANLGPGFDCLGLALQLYDEVTVQLTRKGLDIDVVGEAADEVPRDESHLVVRAFRTAAERLGGQPSGIRLRARNAIPHGRGLGSSAAAVVAGLLAARSLHPDGVRLLPDTDVLALAAALEGHPDNVAPCLLGALTVAWVDTACTPPVRAVRLDPHPRLRPVLFIPMVSLPTRTARGLLPATVPHADAAANAGRAALLTHALTVDPSLLLPATEDRLHQAYRAPAMPGSAELLARLRSAGVPAVISGAGPSVLALTTGDDLPVGAPAGWTVLATGIDRSGATVSPE